MPFRRTSLILPAFFVVVLAMTLWVTNANMRRGKIYIFSPGFVGTVKIHFGIEGAPSFPLKDGFYVIRIPANGEILTSSMPEEGWGEDRFYYGMENESSRLFESGEVSKSGTAQPQTIWNRKMVAGSNLGLFETFFVGPRAGFLKLNPHWGE